MNENGKSGYIATVLVCLSRSLSRCPQRQFRFSARFVIKQVVILNLVAYLTQELTDLQQEFLKLKDQTQISETSRNKTAVSRRGKESRNQSCTGNVVGFSEDCVNGVQVQVQSSRETGTGGGGNGHGGWRGQRHQGVREAIM